MQIKKKILTIPACLALMTTTAHSALILEFNEVGSNVVLTYSGELDLLASYHSDTTRSASNPGLNGIRYEGFTGNGGEAERFVGTDLLVSIGLANIVGTRYSSDAAVGLSIYDSNLYVLSYLDPLVLTSSNNDVTHLSAEAGGALHGKSQTFSTTFATIGLDQHAANTLINMWRVTGTTGTDNLIQFRVNTVPEPSTTLLSGLAGLGLLLRRKRGK